MVGHRFVSGHRVHASRHCVVLGVFGHGLIGMISVGSVTLPNGSMSKRELTGFILKREALL